MERRETEGSFYQAKRISVVRQLLLYMESSGINVYIPHDFCHFTRTQPHIFDSYDFLTRQVNRRPETVKAYRISLSSFYLYITVECNLSVVKFYFTDCTYDFVLEYSQYLQEKKNLSNSTVNQRLAALKTYLRYVSDGNISLMQIYLSVQKVPLLRLVKAQRPVIEVKGLQMLVNKPPNTKRGNRDKMILILLFDTAIRVSELLNITLGDISLEVSVPSILINGKDKKQRAISLNEKTIAHLRGYIKVYHSKDASSDAP